MSSTEFSISKWYKNQSIDDIYLKANSHVKWCLKLIDFYFQQEKNKIRNKIFDD